MLSFESQARVLEGDESRFLLNLLKKSQSLCSAEICKEKSWGSRETASKTVVENGFLDICLEPRKHCLLQGKVLLLLQVHDITRLSAFTPHSCTTLCWFMQASFCQT